MAAVALITRVAVAGLALSPSRSRVAGRGSCSRLSCSLVLLLAGTLAGRSTVPRRGRRGSKRHTRGAFQSQKIYMLNLLVLSADVAANDLILHSLEALPLRFVAAFIFEMNQS